jgi:histidine triad (HIT) family protein
MGVCFAPKDFWGNIMADCLFCKIIRGDIPAKKAYEDDRAFAFHDINPQAPVHVLIIPKRHIAGVEAVSDEFAADVGHLFTVAAQLGRELGVAASGYRTVCNVGGDAGQTVPHLHVHLVGGKPMGWPPFPNR